MTIYIENILLLNFIYDFLILLTVSSTLKRNRKIKWHILSSLFGTISVILLIINVSNFALFILKIFISIVMNIISFGYKSLKYTLSNILYFYITSILLAGFLYLLKIDNVSSKNTFVIFILAPIVLLIYYKSNKYLKNTYSDYYKIIIVFDDIKYNLISFYDNGNSLKDPISKKSIIIVKKNLLKKIYNIRSPVYVSVKTVTGSYLMKCYKPSYILINGKKIYNYLVGESNINFSDGIDVLLNKKLKEDGYV